MSSYHLSEHSPRTFPVIKNKLSEATQQLKENERQYGKYQTFQVDDP